MTYLQIRNWSRFQHYRDRAPAWLKLYTELQRKWEWMTLPDVTKAHLVGLWMLAAELNNRIPDDPRFLAHKLGADSADSVAASLVLLKERAFVEPVEAAPDLLARPEQVGTELLAKPEHAIDEKSSEGRVQNTPPFPPASGGGRALAESEIRAAYERLLRDRLGQGMLVDRAWRRRTWQRLRSGVVESEISAEVALEAAGLSSQRASQDRFRAASDWIEQRGGSRMVAIAVLDWLGRERGLDESEEVALGRWAAEDVPPGVRDRIEHEIWRVRTERDRSPPGPDLPPERSRTGAEDS